MGRVARLILLVVVSVCVVFCVLCCLQNNPVFSSVTYLIISKMKIMSYVFRRVSSLPEKKIQSSVCWVRGSGDYDRKKKIQSKKRYITTGKKRYSRLSDGCAVLAITTGKKKIQSSVCWVRGSGDYDRKKKDSVVFLAGTRSLLRPKRKKDTVVSFWFWRIRPEKKISSSH